MNEARLRGNFFNKAFEYTKKRIGKAGMEKLNWYQEDYIKDGWYDFTQFCQLLQKIDSTVPQRPPSTLYHLGYHLISSDIRWPTMFKGVDPKIVFGSNTRQDDQMKIGEFNVGDLELGKAVINVCLKTDDPVYRDTFAEYYRGVNSAILEITQRQGEVAVQIPEDDPGCLRLEITWE